MTGKLNIRDRAKSLWIKGMKAVGNTAANIANNTRYKVDEVTIQNRRREVLNDLAHKTYALWLKGETFPEAMTKMLSELKQLDEQLNDMRAEKYASSNRMVRPVTEDIPAAAEDEEETEEEEEEDVTPAEVPDSPVSNEINELFDGAASVGKTAEKVNQSLDQLSDRIRNFPQSTESTENEKRQE
ncbi:MAG: hypothetical protein K6F61_10945 [Clostridiales bacterium]|nr:hypothetical protein [Clostridiales bacterium]